MHNIFDTAARKTQTKIKKIGIFPFTLERRKVFSALENFENKIYPPLYDLTI